ncbi:MAG: hypothetical protein JXR88_17255 [Clostridia bacterium]|nr:hypothetical protein [Clostridia bacterium]
MVYRAPEVSDKYLKYTIDGYDIYLAKAAIVGASNIVFTVRGISVFKELVAEGIMYPKV